ncbi:MAG TPA: KH domain-containing protein [Firmicutes bacterium]|nr:KH domain-containing protein [Bacillota bacterium]
MKELVEFIARALVDDPSQVRVDEVDDEKGTVLELRVAPADMGKVIGKQGRTAKAIRTLVKAAATREGKRVTVEIV